MLLCPQRTSRPHFAGVDNTLQVVKEEHEQSKIHASYPTILRAIVVIYSQNSWCKLN